MSDPTLESLRLAGAHHHDPVRFHYLETLDRKMRAQPNAVQNLLAPRLHNALVAYAQNVSSQPRPQPHRAAGRSADTSLGQLNRDLDARHRAEASQALSEGAESMSELRSVRQFSEVWSKVAADKQVTRALHTGPDNAGPLNPHKLMLRSLNLMRTLSPDYLRHFWSQMDSLLWLERMSTTSAVPAAKPARKSRAKR